MNDFDKNDAGIKLLLQRILMYLALVVFILWALSVVESFILRDWKWFLITMQIFFIIKFAFLVSILILPLFFIFGSKISVKFEDKE
jgi:hypothetical protein